FPADHRAGRAGRDHSWHALHVRPAGIGAVGGRLARPAGARPASGSDRRLRTPRAMNISHVFFDVGGVLGTNGWDQHQRAAAVARFGPAAAELAPPPEGSVPGGGTG